MENQKPIHIAVIPSPGFSHLVPILQFSKRLVELHHPHFHVTCIIPSFGSPPSASKSYLETLPSNISSIFLPSINPNDLPQVNGEDKVVVQFFFTLKLSLPFIHNALKSLKTPIVALVVDHFASEALDFAKEFNFLSYVYFPVSATTLSLHFHLPKLDDETEPSLEYRDLPEPIKMKGCVPLHGSDLYTLTQNRSSLVYKFTLERAKSFRFVDGVFVNTFLELEEGPLRALTEEGSGIPPVYPVGPLIRTEKNEENGFCESLEWLDKQKACSVLYVSFGSGGTLSQEQIDELAYGLELSGHGFLWVVRAPSSSPSAAYLGSQGDLNPLDFLPKGFLERTKEKGLVVPSWASQIQVLDHGSVGGFLSHCGWNSILESVVKGVPLITWPLFAEQKINAAVINDGLKVGIRPTVNENGVVEREEVARVVKCLMEGEEGRKLHTRMKELKDAATNALKDDGSSTKTLSELTQKCKSLV